MESYPKFHNEVGVPIVRIGCREFKCIGDKPPQDHPHIYLNMGEASEILCPYCSTLFRFCLVLAQRASDPDLRTGFLSLAQKWLDLANGGSLNALNRRLDEFNRRQMFE